MAYDGAGLSLIGQLIGGRKKHWEYETTDSPATCIGANYFSDGVARGLEVGDKVRIVNSSTGVEVNVYISSVTATAATASPKADAKAVTWTISLAASATTDGLEATFTARDAFGNAVAAVTPLQWWISEAATGIGLTADSYSGTVTAVSTYGDIGTAITAKKHFLSHTNASGIFRALAVASANPTDQYFVAVLPNGTGVVVSTASGTNWEGA